MNTVFVATKKFATSLGVMWGFFLLKQYSIVCVNLKNYIHDQYYNNKMVQVFLNFLFEWYHFLFIAILSKHMEPFYNPWLTIFYMKSGVANENYYNLSPTAQITELSKFGGLLQWNPSQLNTESPYELFNNIYSTSNYIKTVYFDKCYDYLIIMKIKDVYISRVGIYNGTKNLRKEDFSLEKAARSILMIEYQHPKMTKPIALNIDTGYFIENNEILSPMFVQRCLMFQREPYVFDYSYKLKFMDSSIKNHTIDSNSFVLLKRSGYEIITF
jgi:hypothetical protein